MVRIAMNAYPSRPMPIAKMRQSGFRLVANRATTRAAVHTIACAATPPSVAGSKRSILNGTVERLCAFHPAVGRR